MHDMIYDLSDKIVCKERVKQGVGILHSERANAYYDAVCNGDNENAWQGGESNIFSVMEIYRSFKRQFVSLTAVRASELDKLPFDLKVLIVPAEKGLSDDEKMQIDKFRKSGGKAFYYDEYFDSFKPFDFNDKWFEAFEIVDLYATKIAATEEKKVDLKFLEDENEYAISVIDFAENEREINNLNVELLFKTDAETCFFVSGDTRAELPVVTEKNNKKIVIPKLKNGGILFIEKR